MNKRNSCLILDNDFISGPPQIIYISWAMLFFPNSREIDSHIYWPTSNIIIAHISDERARCPTGDERREKKRLDILFFIEN